MKLAGDIPPRSMWVIKTRLRNNDNVNAAFRLIFLIMASWVKKQKAAASSKKSTRKALTVTVKKRFYQVRWLIPMGRGQLNVFTYQSMT
ncbi:hypothetical protein NT690_002080, partial [Cronobacter sakazakii]|nr:hypothetical protein [Cronobacter sakazakii]